ncbi:DUF4334 domain-containing protein [Pontibacter sp. G13]|uniref:DUF4334 domain-containing protein n=1 Tax=Pontibacter sp. G13 TaxID=3074898 RepID=UPI00288A3456|nr:DUF4334 domain-containing protein [Pontibacter sp. G13]WNJ17699.1 DUF4334 domain-containing protein [Pontibacter sp. G13]
MKTLSEFLQFGGTTDEVADYYDQLPPIPTDFMIGRWKGSEIPTGHAIDGLLEPSGWYGKQFISEEAVHPLLFWTRSKRKVFSVNPLLIPLTFPFPKTPILGTLMGLLRPILQTRHSKARLRKVLYRGKESAAMVYDEKAIIDHFRMVDDRTVMGAMDLKGNPDPYFFLLERDDDSDLPFDHRISNR